MEDNFYYTELFELYKGLLTEKQREIFEAHYCLDLSYSEISESEGTSRQNAYDAVKKVKDKLIEFEKQLKLKQKYNDLIGLANGLDKKSADVIKEIIGR